jgi:hypothetical protein
MALYKAVRDGNIATELLPVARINDRPFEA